MAFRSDEPPELREDPPPLFATWGRLYAVVIGYLAFLIFLFYLFPQAYQNPQ